MKRFSIHETVFQLLYDASIKVNRTFYKTYVTMTTCRSKALSTDHTKESQTTQRHTAETLNDGKDKLWDLRVYRNELKNPRTCQL